MSHSFYFYVRQITIASFHLPPPSSPRPNSPGAPPRIPQSAYPSIQAPPPPLLFLLSTLTPIFSSREFYQELSILLFSICTSSLVFLAFHSSVDPLVPVGSALHLHCCTTRAFASTILVQLPPLDVNGIKRLWPHNHSPLTLFLYRIALRCTCLLIQKYPFIL